MTGLENALVNSSNIDLAAKKAEGFLKKLFGKALDETGEMIADQVRLRRFKNQIKIFEKAKKYLKGKKEADYEKINLKVLAPLIEYSSYEEDEKLQDKWAKLIKNILIQPTSTLCQQNAIQILNKISNEEVLFLENLYEKVQFERKEIVSKQNKSFTELGLKKYKNINHVPVESFSYRLADLSKELQITISKLIYMCSNLKTLGILKDEIEVKLFNIETVPNKKHVPFAGEIIENKIKLTNFGFNFIELCK